MRRLKMRNVTTNGFFPATFAKFDIARGYRMRVVNVKIPQLAFARLELETVSLPFSTEAFLRNVLSSKLPPPKTFLYSMLGRPKIQPGKSRFLF